MERALVISLLVILFLVGLSPSVNAVVDHDERGVDIETEEILTDLVAISALKIIVQSKRLYEDTLIIRSYIGGEQGKEYFGSDIQKDVLKHPESYLRKLLHSTKAR